MFYIFRILLALLFLPVIQIMLFHLTVGREPSGISVAYFSQDWNNFKVKNNISGKNSLPGYCSLFNISLNNGCFPHALSGICTFFNQFNTDEIDWVLSNFFISVMSSEFLYIFFRAVTINFSI